jgi:probable F420-dependent oxidoreductase
MKFAISYSPPYHGVDPDVIAAYAQHAEACGFEGFYLPEHVVLFPGATIGEWDMPPSLAYPDPLDILAYVAGVTSRILLGTGVLLLPYHHPVILAKRLATIDVLSRGRMRLLTVGLGAIPGEAAAVGVDFASRGRRADEAIDLMRLLWAGGEEGVSYQGEFFTADRLVSFPKPYQADTLPIHVGGSSRAAARRAGRRGDGYYPGGMLLPDERAIQLKIALDEAAKAGRDPDAFEYTRPGSIDLTPERAEKLAPQGITRIVVGSPSTDPAEQRDQMSAFAERFGLS